VHEGLVHLFGVFAINVHLVVVVEEPLTVLALFLWFSLLWCGLGCGLRRGSLDLLLLGCGCLGLSTTSWHAFGELLSDWALGGSLPLSDLLEV